MSRAFELKCSDSGRHAALAIELDQGNRYRVLAERTLRSALCTQLRSRGLAVIVSADGGFIGNLRVWENLILPLEWRGVRRDVLWPLVGSILDELGFVQEEAERLCQAMPETLSPFEARAALFARGLLLAPEMIVFDRLFVGLGRLESERAAAFQSVLDTRLPLRTAVYLDEDDPPFASVPVTHRHDFRASA